MGQSDLFNGVKLLQWKMLEADECSIVRLLAFMLVITKR